MIRIFVIVVVCCLSVMKEAVADSATMSQAINFGNIRISNSRSAASIVLGTDGEYGAKSNIALSSGQKSGVIVYNANGFFSLLGVNVTADTDAAGSLSCSSSSCSGCNITFDSMTVNPTSQRISRNSSGNFNYGGKLNIPANCGHGTFSGSLTVSYSGNWFESITSSLPVTVVIDPQPVNVQSTQDLSFGAVLSTVTHDVVVSPNGSRQSSAYVINDSSYPPTNGIIKISKEEAGSRTVTVAVDSQTSISNGGTSLTVDLVTDLPTSSITLTSNDTYINVGGTLHVTQGAPAGEYTGTYRIEVAY